MKLLSAALPLLLASTASARSPPFSTSDSLTPQDDAYTVPGKNPLKHCTDPKDDILTLKSVDLDPNPPKAGTNLSVVATGTLSKDVEDGAMVHLQIKYGLITIIRQTANLCDTVKNVGLECPLKKGELKFSKDVALPKEIPPGKYSVVADVLTEDDDKITCLEAQVQFGRGGLGGLFKQDI